MMQNLIVKMMLKKVFALFGQTKLIWLALLMVGTTAHAGVTVRYQHTDALGSVMMETNASGQMIGSRHQYQPFGQGLNGQKTGLGYTGHLEDTDLGLTYMQQRYYDPVIGRFYSNDPVGFTPSNPMMFNRYAYANNNPYRYVDLDGRAPCSTGSHIKGSQVQGCTSVGAMDDTSVKFKAEATIGKVFKMAYDKDSGLTSKIALSKEGFKLSYDSKGKINLEANGPNGDSFEVGLNHEENALVKNMLNVKSFSMEAKLSTTGMLEVTGKLSLFGGNVLPTFSAEFSPGAYLRISLTGERLYKYFGGDLNTHANECAAAYVANDESGISKC